MATTNVIHVAAFILQQTGTLTTMKLQKLIYYGQAWSLVWDGEPLFQQRETRQGLSDRERGYREISLAAMAEYYEGVYNEGVEIEA